MPKTLFCPQFGLAVPLLAFAVGGCTGATPEPEAEPASAPQVAVGPTVREVSLAEVGLEAAALDRTADPCTDFYAFACGGWLEKTEIPADRSRWVRSFSVINERNEADLKAIAEGAEAKVGRFFQACMNEETVEKAGLAPLHPLFAKIRGAKGAKSLPPVLAELHRHRVWAFFDLSATQDFKDATAVIGGIDQAGLGMPDRDYYLSDDDKKKKIRQAYAAHVERMMGLSGLSAPRAKAARRDVMRVETALAKVSKTRVERRDPVKMYNKLDLSGVMKAAPGFGWKAYLQTLGHPDLVDLTVSAPKFLEGMNGLLKSMRAGTLQNYLRWHVLRTFAGSLSKPFFDEAFSFQKVLSGQDEPLPRWKRCVSATDHALGELFAQAFVEKRFAGESKTAAEEYVKQISEAFLRNLDSLAWMDEETKTRAKEKLSKFSYLVGYPSKWKAYDFELSEVHATNKLRSSVFETNLDLDRIGKPVDRERWEMTPPTVNAYYHPLKNQMVFPAGILQPPFYSVTAHVPVNLGAMGMVVGHELTHGFDDQGSQFDGDGNLEMWWTSASREAFEDKTSCVVEQYETYEPVPGARLNGKLTLGENIADIGGLKLAFTAYREIRKEASELKVAEGFTEDQQFFLANAQVWCAKTREPEARRRAQIDPHSDPRSRVNGPMSNLKVFADAFQCAAGTPMNPEKVCAVW